MNTRKRPRALRLFAIASALLIAFGIVRGPEARAVSASDDIDFICLNGENPLRQNFNEASASISLTHNFYAVPYTNDRYMVLSDFIVSISLPTRGSSKLIKDFTFYAFPNQWADNPTGVQYTGGVPNMKGALPHGSVTGTQEATVTGFSIGLGLEKGLKFEFGTDGGALSAEASSKSSITFSYQHSLSVTTDEPQVQYFYGIDDDLPLPGAKWYLNFKTRDFKLFTQRFVLIYSVEKGGTNMGPEELGVSIHVGFRITTNEENDLGMIVDEVTGGNDTGFALRYYF